MILKQEKLYANLKKCTFYTDHIIFLGFIISANRVQVQHTGPELLWLSGILSLLR